MKTDLPPWLEKAIGPLLIFGAVASAVSGVKDVASSQNILVASAAVFLIAAAWVVHTWKSRTGTAARGLSLAAALAALGGLGYAGYVEFKPPARPPALFAIDLLIDSSLEYSVSGVNTVTSYFKGSGVGISMRQVPVDDAESPGIVTPGDIKNQLSRLALADSRARAREVVPIWVTGLRLKGEIYPNLIARRYPSMSVVSTRGVGERASIRDPAVARYVAVIAVIEAAEVLAMRAGAELLPGREGGVDRGCLADIHELRQTFIEASARPRLCDEESAAIARLLGEHTLKAITQVLTNIGT
jgi:hypothetical protein